MVFEVENSLCFSDELVYDLYPNLYSGDQFGNYDESLIYLDENLWLLDCGFSNPDEFMKFIFS
jgi:hypothetical protein